MEKKTVTYSLNKDEAVRYSCINVRKENDKLIIDISFDDIKNSVIIARTILNEEQIFVGVKGMEDYPCIAKGLCGSTVFEFRDKFYWKYSNERVATEEEIKLFNELLLENGWKYDKEKGFVKVKPRAKEGEEYYYISEKLEIDCDCDIRTYIDNKRYESNNYSLVKEELEKKLERVKKIMKE